MGIISSGVTQWLIQRFCNAMIVTFGVALVLFFLTNETITYQTLVATFKEGFLKYYLVLVLVLSCFNSVLAAWQIDGDYAKKFNLPALLITALTAIVSIVYLGFGLKLILGH